MWPAGEGWIKANLEHTGFYRVNYDSQNWARLIQHLNDNPDSSVSRPAVGIHVIRIASHLLRMCTCVFTCVYNFVL